MKILSTILTIIFILTYSMAFAIPASSDTEPAKYTKCRGLVQVAYDVKQVDVIDMEGKTHKVWQYEYVEIDGSVTKAKFKDALGKESLKKKADKPWTPDEAVAEYIEENPVVEVPKK